MQSRPNSQAATVSLSFRPEGLEICSVVHLYSAMEAFQPLGTATTSLVATRLATEKCWQRGGGRVAGTLGGAADAWRAGGGDVSEL